MKKKRLLTEVIFVISTIINAIMYIADGLLYVELHKYKDYENIPVSKASFMLVLLIIEILSLIMLSSSINKDSSPYHKLYTKKTKPIYWGFLALMFLRYVTISVSNAGNAYVALWGVLMLISSFTYVWICKNLSYIFEHNEDLCIKLEEEYYIEVSDKELDILKQIKKFLLIIIGVVLVATLFCEVIFSNLIVNIVYTSIYVFIIGYSTLDIFRFYFKRRFVLIIVCNCIFAAIGSTIVWLISNNIIFISFLSGRPEEELILIQFLFLLPCILWFGNKLKKYQRLSFNKISNKFK